MYARLYGQSLGFVLFSLPTYFLWRGFSWARVLTLWFIVLSLIGRYFYFYRGMEIVDLWDSAHLVEVFSLVFDIFLLVWLNLPVVKAHFKAPKKLKSY
jgi:thiol:disulfide interchange protein